MMGQDLWLRQSWNPKCPPKLLLTLRQGLEIDFAPIGAMASCSPCPHLEAIDVARAQPCHSGSVSLTGHGEGVGFVFCLGTTITHYFVPAFMPRFSL